MGILFVAFLVQHREAFAGDWGAGALVLLGLAAVFGVYLAFVGMARPHSMALYAHVGSAIVALFFRLMRWSRRGGGGRADTDGLQSAWRWSLGVMLAAGAFYAVVATYHYVHSAPRLRIQNSSTAPLSMDNEGGA